MVTPAVMQSTSGSPEMQSPPAQSQLADWFAAHWTALSHRWRRGTLPSLDSCEAAAPFASHASPSPTPSAPKRMFTPGSDEIHLQRPAKLQRAEMLGQDGSGPQGGLSTPVPRDSADRGQSEKVSSAAEMFG